MTDDPVLVLVVEDESLVRMGIVLHLEDEGFEVLEASNAEEAIRLLIANPQVNVVFTDIDMPGSMDGLMLVAAVRDRWPPIRLVVTSGHRSVDPSELPGDARFFSKPYDPVAIATTLRAMSAA